MIDIRRATPEDAEALVRIHADASAYYAELEPALFQTPDLTGYAELVERDLAEADDTTLDLVAAVGDEIVATLYARLITPQEGAEYAYPRDVTRTRVEIAYLATSAQHRRSGAGLALVEAAEAWGREHGATVAEASTYHRSALSIPFWTLGAGYAPRSIVFRKEL
ncbi:GNAT family N-acetyltransferase [Solirubrobacter ginsenosidimutans]|uniref:GNAT family N-acetyltransferase n=1 Tax=Solirubrobacter ginsenosidimutans TaxID=490573 RepID=A0A9X3S602_9ACTN|nr:GNAT family N-acetyltransferase [Solirubrobacter ginsenosidimutans]MDA0164701.1 GNAT family N-acetyltransferase [Solirubrobacter ginsenosidimutans]